MAKEVCHSYEGHDITITVKKKRKTRSIEHNGYYWAVVISLILETFIDLGNELQVGNSDHEKMIHELMKGKFLFNGITIADADGTVYDLPPSTTRCNSLEFMEYIDRVRKWASEVLNIDIPDPEKQRELSFSNNNRRG